MRSRQVLFFALTVLVVTVTASVAQPHTPGSVYTARNATDGNSVLVYSRSAWGNLAPAGSFSTGGLGTGTGLGNQGGVILSSDDRWLFVVNAGSDEISAFSVQANGLTLTDKVWSG